MKAWYEMRDDTKENPSHTVGEEESEKKSNVIINMV